MVNAEGVCQAPQYRFAAGEYLEFKLNYGWFTIGKGYYQLEKEEVNYQGQQCYQVKVGGGSSGFLNVFTKVEDEWGATLRKDDLRPVFTYRDIHEGRYQLEEQIYIDQDSGSIRVEQYKAHRGQPRRPTKHYEFDPSQGVFDMLGGMLQVRNLDLSQFSSGDTIRVRAFFEDTFYDFKILYTGKEKLKTKVGKLQAHRLVPLMPQNSVFDGKRSLTAWFSDDLNQLPLKVTADMFIGKASCEIVSFKNVKYGGNSD